MRVERLRVIALIGLVMGACGPRTVLEPHLRIGVEVDKRPYRSVCVKLELRAVDTDMPLGLTEGAPFDRTRLKLTAIVVRGQLPQTIRVQALGFSDAACTVPTSPPEVSQVGTFTFPQFGVRDETLTLQPAAMSMDADGDLVPPPEDCNDMDPTVAPGKDEVCTDGKDNDCDQGIDCADSACAGQRCSGVASVCASNRCTETDCANGMDDDGDGAADCADTDCASRPCLNGGTCTAGACVGATNERGLCGDAVDNDRDTKVDCLDDDCVGEVCSDGRGCTTGERCSSFQCDGGMPVVCGAGTNVCASSMGSCQEPDGGCLYPPLSSDAGCSDGLACTLGDACDGDGGCVGTSLRLCDTPPAGACYAQTGTCDEASDGGCRYAFVAGLSCDDSNPCTRDDACLADGTCMGGGMVDCSMASPPGECQVPTGSCSQATGCEFMPRSGACGDGGTCVGTACVPPDAGPVDAGGPMDAGVDAGLPDGGPGDAGAADAGTDAGLPLDAGTFLAPSNFGLNQLPTFLVPPHYNLNCSGTISLNNNVPTFAPDEGLCFAPFLPPSTRVSQGAGLPELVLFAMDRLTIQTGVTLRFAPGLFSSSPNVVPVFAVRGDATIDGTIDLSALPGPNRMGSRENAVGAGGSFCVGPSAGVAVVDRSGGGAGGSFGLVGGPGGRGADIGASLGGAGASASAANGGPALTPLRGGCPGSAGGNAADGFGRAGGGFQVWAQRTLTVNGRIVAAGGPGVVVNGTYGAGGGGGGSGGGLLLEGTSVVFGANALVAANGGSGAKGNGTNNTGVSGNYGTFDTTRAAPGVGGAQCGGPGGPGGARAGDAGVGVQGDLDPACVITGFGGGGGGGGAVGRVRINALTGCTVGANARFSPQTTSNQPSCVR
jgi:hypothetical protein